MKCELIAVGTELLLGEVANLDAQILSQGLSELGINVFHHTVVGDNPARLRQVLEIAAARADLIITTGGLGPTTDDLTKETVADVFGLPLEMNQEQLARLKQRMGPGMTSNNEKQAVMPRGCTVLVNDWGTAPGSAFYAKGCHVIMLPGPPRECTPMFRYRAMPYLESLQDGVISSTYLKIFGIGESSMETLLLPLMEELHDVTIAPYAKVGECEVRITARRETKEAAAAACAPVAERVRAILGDYVYGTDVTSLEEVVVRGLLDRGLALALAESCTGGMVAKRITDISGASGCFAYGCVTYSNQAKQRLLGVSAETLDAYGAVSAQTALEMARGVRNLAGSDIGVGITGVAGPNPSEEKEVGLVYVAISHSAGERVMEIPRRHSPDRERIRHSAASHALDLVRREILLK